MVTLPKNRKCGSAAIFSNCALIDLIFGWSGATPERTSPQGVGSISIMSTRKSRSFFNSEAAAKNPDGPEPTIATWYGRIWSLFFRLPGGAQGAVASSPEGLPHPMLAAVGRSRAESGEAAGNLNNRGSRPSCRYRRPRHHVDDRGAGARCRGSARPHRNAGGRGRGPQPVERPDARAEGHQRVVARPERTAPRGGTAPAHRRSAGALRTRRRGGWRGREGRS